MITLRIPPEVHWVLKKYSDGNYQVALRELIKRYAKKLLDKNGIKVDSEADLTEIAQSFEIEEME